MPPTVLLTSAWMGAFILTHLGLGQPPLRDTLVGWLGEVRFTVLYSLISWAVLGALFYQYLAHRAQSPPGLGLAEQPGVMTTATVMMGLGMVFIVSIIAPSAYLRSAAVVFGTHTRAARGLERMTRHPFFVGLTLLSLGHILVAPRLTGVIVFAGFAFISVVGGVLQDRKLLARREQAHAEYLRTTSFIPLLAILRGRQTLALDELPWIAIVLALPIAWGARWLHGTGHGPWLVMSALVVGPLWFAIASAFRNHRARSH